MRLIALEEHYRSKQVDAEIGEAGDYFRTMNSAGEVIAGHRLSNLTDLGERRIADMDRGGIDVQVLSHTHPSPEILEASRAIPLCRRVNDEVAEAVARYPTRFAGFAALPVADPPAAARELERAVRQLGFKGALINGMVQGRFLDDPSFTPLLECALALEVPLYLHPATRRRKRCKKHISPDSSPASPGCWRSPAGAGGMPNRASTRFA
jgi:predicted TIM-barrel fold metal-dependent hydrolase